MGIRKLAVAAVFGFFAASGAVFAQGQVEEGIEEEVAEEEAVSPPAPVAAAPAPAVAAPAPVPAPVAVAPAPAAVKAEPKVDFYGAVQYRLRENMTSRNYEVQKYNTGTKPDPNDSTGSAVLPDTVKNGAPESVTGSTGDYFNMFSWRMGLKAKVNDALSLQFQIGNDWGAGEGFSWSNNNMPSARAGFDNLYVHIASFKWNPGYMFVEGGVISIPSSGTLDLLERSLNKGHYGEAGFQGWSTEANASLLGLKIGLPVVNGDVKVGVEVFQSLIDQRSQTMDTGSIAPNPTSPMFVVTLPVEAGQLKLTPELTVVVNRNYNGKLEKGDNETIFGLGGSYAVNKGLSFSLLSGYGSISNENSKAGSYAFDNGTNRTAADRVSADTDSAAAAKKFKAYNSNGVLLGVGASIKAGPGNIQIDFKYNSAVDAENEEYTKMDYIYADFRYGLKVNDKFTVTPRYRAYYKTYPEKFDYTFAKRRRTVSNLVNRPELILEGSF